MQRTVFKRQRSTASCRGHRDDGFLALRPVGFGSTAQDRQSFLNRTIPGWKRTIRQASSTCADTQILSGTNSFTGGTTISAGTLALGTGTAPAASTILADGGAVNVNGGTLDLAGRSETVGAITSTSGRFTSTPGQAGLAGNAGTITGTSLVKTGGGTTTINPGVTIVAPGTNTVSGGTLVVDGLITGSEAISGGGVLGGTGSISGSVSFSGGTLAPGNSPGVLSTGSLTLDNTSTYAVEIIGTGSTPGDLTNGYDQTRVTGSVDVTGSTLTLSLSSYSVAQNSLLFILVNDTVNSDLVSGTFNGLADGTTFTQGGQQFKISYFGNTSDFSSGTFTGGNDIVLQAVPEPSTWAAILGGMGILVGAQTLRRRRIN